MIGILSRRSALIALGTAAFARPAFADRALLAKLRQQGSIKVGLANNLPWSTVNVDGTMSGISPVIVSSAMQQMGIPKVEGIIASYGELIPGLMAGRWDMIGASMIISPERCKQIRFSDPFFKERSATWVGFVKSDVAEPPKSYREAALHFERVGFVSGMPEISVFKEAVTAAGGKASVVQFSDFGLVIQAMKAKRIDLAIADSKSFGVLKKQVGGFEVEPIDSGHPDRGAAGAFRMEDTDLSDAFNSAYRELKKSGEVAKILAQYDFEYDADAMNITGEQACSL